MGRASSDSSVRILLGRYLRPSNGIRRVRYSAEVGTSEHRCRDSSAPQTPLGTTEEIESRENKRHSERRGIPISDPRLGKVLLSSRSLLQRERQASDAFADLTLA